MKTAPVQHYERGNTKLYDIDSYSNSHQMDFPSIIGSRVSNDTVTEMMRGCVHTYPCTLSSLRFLGTQI